MSAIMPRETRLANGLTVIHLHTKNDPISACHLFIPGGADREPNNKSGISSLSWSLLTKGTKKRTARQMAEDIESIGASIGAGATHDYSEISCHAISEYFLHALEILGDALFNPGLVLAEVEKERTSLLAAIRSKKESIFTLANEELNRLLYGTHAYARPASGTEKSVSSITMEDLTRWHKKIVTPNQAILSVASNLPFDQIVDVVSKIFGPKVWKKQNISAAFPFAAPPPLKKSHTARLEEQFEQAYLLIGFPAPPVASKDYIPLKILNACLGGGMSARLFQKLREQEGLAYDVGAFYASKKCGSAFVVYMGLQPSRMREARQRIENVLTDVRAKKFSTQELSETKNFIKGTYILDHQTNSQRAHYLGWWQALDLGPKFDRMYLDKIDRVSAEDVLRVGRKVLGGKSVTIEIYPKKSVLKTPSLAHAN